MFYFFGFLVLFGIAGPIIVALLAFAFSKREARVKSAVIGAGGAMALWAFVFIIFAGIVLSNFANPRSDVPRDEYRPHPEDSKQWGRVIKETVPACMNWLHASETDYASKHNGQYACVFNDLKDYLNSYESIRFRLTFCSASEKSTNCADLQRNGMPDYRITLWCTPEGFYAKASARSTGFPMFRIEADGKMSITPKRRWSGTKVMRPDETYISYPESEDLTLVDEYGDSLGRVQIQKYGPHLGEWVWHAQPDPSSSGSREGNTGYVETKEQAIDAVEQSLPPSPKDAR
jgi:hypothetical protein